MTTTMRNDHRGRRVLLAVAITATTLPAAVAQAGTYAITGTCGTWTQFGGGDNRLTAFSECPTLRARNVLGNFQTPATAKPAGWRFDAPPGTTIDRLDISGSVTGGEHWGADLRAFTPFQGGSGVAELYFERCQAQAGCSAPFEGLYSGLGVTGPIVGSVYCLSGPCDNGGQKPRATLEINRAEVTINDPVPPSAAIAGGSIAAPGWHGGQRTLAVRAADNSGVRAVRGLSNGDARYSDTTALPCDFSKSRPCGDHDSAQTTINLGGLPDGQHQLAAQAEDAGGEPGTSASQIINVDNTAPTAVGGLRLDRGGWQRKNAFTAAWSNPAQQFAPIAGVDFQVCPAGQPLGGPGCQVGSRDGTDLTQMAFAVPGPGAWRLALWPRDAAGNHSGEQAAYVGGFGLLAKGKTTRLRVGKPSRTRRGAKKRTGKLKRQVTVRRGRGVTLRGRLSRRGKGLTRQLLVYRRTAVEGANSRLVKRITTNKRGRLRYRAKPGAGRRLHFVYPGGGGLRGRSASVNVRVRAKLTTHVDRRTLRNGEVVILSGRLAGGRIPPEGALLEVQVFTRGRWRPFATPRTDPTGGWSQPYRFETVTGSARFRFRAVLRKQATYPYIARSRPVSVKVRGT